MTRVGLKLEQHLRGTLRIAGARQFSRKFQAIFWTRFDIQQQLARAEHEISATDGECGARDQAASQGRAFAPQRDVGRTITQEVERSAPGQLTHDRDAQQIRRAGRSVMLDAQDPS